MQGVIGGASLGRATLEARHQFATQYSHLDPTDLKTLGQYYLLGDPSIQAVEIAPHGLYNTKTYKASFTEIASGTRVLRRDRLHRSGTELKRDLPKTVAAKSGAAAEPSRMVTKVLHNAAAETGVKDYTTMHFHIVHKGRDAKAMDPKRSVHLLIGARQQGKETESARVKNIVAIVATAEDGKLLHLRRLHSR